MKSSNGDGDYRDGDGHTYAVESGIIAAIPQELTHPKYPGERMSELSRTIVAEGPVHCSTDERGNLTFGDVLIRTGPNDEEEAQWRRETPR